MMEYYSILFACLSWLSICDTTLLWRINVNPPAYLLGTVHLPYTYLWPSLSNTTKSAFYNSTHFLPEFDMTNFFSFTRFRMCMNSYMLASANGPPPPGSTSQTGGDSSILDIYLTAQARRLNKTVTSLESVDMYCEFTKFQIDSLTTDLTSNANNKPPRPNENGYDQMKHVYNCDFNYPGEYFPPTPMHIPDKTLLAFQQRLGEIVGRRDTKMAQTIDSLLKEASPDKRFFFAVGYIHLMGAEGIITKLKRDHKYSVERLCTDPPKFRATLGCQASSWCDPISRL